MDEAPAPRVRGRPTYISADNVAEIAFRAYIIGFDPPLEYATAMQCSEQEIAKMRRNAMIYAPILRGMARAMVDLGFIDKNVLTQ